MQYDKITQKNTNINTNESRHSEMSPVRQNPLQKTVRTAHLSVLMTVHTAQLQYAIQHRTVLIISPLSSRSKHEHMLQLVPQPSTTIKLLQQLWDQQHSASA